MPVFPNIDRKIKFLPRFTIQILIFLLLSGFSVLALKPLQSIIQKEITNIRETVINRAEEILGCEIRYDSIRPGLLFAFDIRGIKILNAEQDEARQLVSIARLRITYSLWDIITNNKRAIHSVLIDRPYINLDTAKDTALIENIKNFTSNNAERADADNAPFMRKIQEALRDNIPQRAVLKIRGARCGVQNGRDQFSMSGGYADVSVRPNELMVDGRCTGNISLLKIAPVQSKFNIRLKGGYSTDTENGNIRAKIPYITSDYFKLFPIEFDINFSSDAVVLKTLQKGAPWELSAEYNLDSDAFNVRYICENLPFNKFLVFNGVMKRADSWLSIVSSGEASFERNNRGNIQYRIDMDGQVPPSTGTGSFSFHAAGNEKNAKIREFCFLAPSHDNNLYSGGPFQGEINFNGNINFQPFTPNGFFSLSDFSISGKEKLNAAFDITTESNVTNIFCQTLDFGLVSLDAVDAAIIPAKNSVGFILTALRFRNIESYTNVKLSTLAIDGSIDYEPAQISATLRLDSFSAADIEGMMRPFVHEADLSSVMQNLLNDILITTEVFWTTDFEHVLYNAPRFITAFESRLRDETQFPISSLNPGVLENGVGVFSISGTNSRINLSEGSFIFRSNLFSINGFIDYSNPMDINFSLMTNYRDISYYLEGYFLDKRSMSIQGSHGLSVYIDSGINGSYSGIIQVDNLPLPYRNGIGSFSLLASLRYDSEYFWAVDLERCELVNIDTPAGSANFQMAGSANQNGVRIPRISYSDGKGLLEGNSFFTWTRNTLISDSKDSELELSGSLVLGNNSERLLAFVDFSEQRLNISVTGKGIQIGRFSSSLLNAAANAEVQVNWDAVNSLQIKFLLDSLDARIQDKDLHVSAGGYLNGNEISVSNFNINFFGIEGRIPQFRINLDEGIVHTNADIRGYAAGRWVDGLFSVDVKFKPIESWLTISEALNSFSGTFHAERIQYGDLSEIEPFDFFIARSEGNTSISGGPQNMLRSHISPSGNFYLSLSGPSPVRGSVIGKIEKNTINASSNDIYVDLGQLWQLLPTQSDLVLSGGYAAAEVEIRGSLQDPEFFGLIRGNSVRIQVPYYLTRDVRPIPFEAVIDGNEIRLDPVPVTVGSGAGIVSGWFRFDRWIPNIFRLDINVPQETSIPFGIDIAGFLASGNVSGKLILAMDNLVMNVTGDLSVNDTEIGLSYDEVIQSELFGDIIIPAVVDINIITGSTVEFLWPSSSIPILRLNPDIGTTAKITADTNARQFSINSDIRIRNGEIYYFERSFYIRSGTLTLRENEIRFEPRLTVRAEARDRNDEGPVIISMLVDNAPLFSFTARFESTPSLSQMEIFALLGQNLTGSHIDEATGNIQRAFLGSSADLIAQFVVVRQVERQIRKFTHLDMFSIRTQLLQNAVFNVTGLNQTPVDRSAVVGNYFDNTTVFLGKYIGADMFAQTMLALRYDEYKTTAGGLRLEWDIGIELQSPLFNIRWDFIPTHPENWWVNDNSITLTWRKTY